MSVPPLSLATIAFFLSQFALNFLHHLADHAALVNLTPPIHFHQWEFLHLKVS